MSVADITRESHRTGTTRAAENAYTANAYLGVIKYMVNNYNLCIDAINSATGGHLPHIKIVEE